MIKKTIFPNPQRLDHPKLTRSVSLTSLFYSSELSGAHRRSRQLVKINRANSLGRSADPHNDKPKQSKVSKPQKDKIFSRSSSNIDTSKKEKPKLFKEKQKTLLQISHEFQKMKKKERQV